MERAYVLMFTGGLVGTLVALPLTLILLPAGPTLAAIALGGVCALVGMSLGGWWGTRC